MAANRSAEDHWIGQIDGIVEEVFQMMLQRSCGVADDAAEIGIDISARVLISGTVEGRCVIQFPSASARKLTTLFLGSEGSEGGWDDAMIEDAVGELCNMIAGGWKTRLCMLDSVCDLSVPSISRGLDLDSSDAGTLGVRRNYAFDDSVFTVNLAIL